MAPALQLRLNGLVLSSNGIESVASEILSYFVRNPHAADTLEGIARWRLLDEIVHRKVEEARLALVWLVERGFLVETSAPGVGPIFGLDPNNLAEAERFLAARSSRKRRRAG
jgi:hypothetical protein